MAKLQKKENRKQKNILRGIIYMGINTIIFIKRTQLINKNEK